MSPAPAPHTTPARAKDSRRKPLAQLHAEAQALDLKRTLTLRQLLLLGIGTVVGAGIYVMTGTAAANFAGPSVLLAFLVAALACVFTALCYGELAALFPVAGSTYSYAYVTMSERTAWWVGWLSLLEFAISCTAVAAGLSGYANALLGTFHLKLPGFLTHPTLMTVPGSGGQAMTAGWRFDLLGLGSIMVVTLVLMKGIHESSRLNDVIVLLKVGAILLFVGVGAFWVDMSNFHPFIPASKGDFQFGWGGVFRAASVLFFAYTGFEAVSTAAAEARNPTRDVPWAIVGTLFVCMLIFMAVAAVLIGVVPYQALNVPDPLAVATHAMNKPWLGLLVSGAATIGLFTGLFGLLYAQSRILMVMAQDGLLPPVFARLNKRFHTPLLGTLIIGVGVALLTAVLPIDVIGDLVSIGIALGYAQVCLNVIWCRNTMPERERPFKVPLGGVTIKGIWLGTVPVLGILFCLLMMVPLLANMLEALGKGNAIPFALTALYVGSGWALYHFYGRHHSTMHPDRRNVNFQEGEGAPSHGD
ncbi:amino acid permease [Formicincola oecophyllae]|uniref:Amino acid permease n=1 Tax=Formicincola oecophyllae TaxID=2558361 RepID=A0A4Y6U9V8_9PROT|nr:amino acid permease [Formicincola oecophyllae]QDH12935.1 amino acid permease [Formicincola oecophyllae]